MNNITLPADLLFTLGPIPITNGFFGALLISLTIILLGALAASRFSIVPTRLQVVFEMLHDYIFEQLREAFGSETRARAFFPLFATMLLFLVIANEFTIVPFVFEVVYGEVDFFRQPTSDFAGPIALSLMVMVIAQVMAISISPIRHLGNFFPVHEFAKVRSAGDFMNACIGMFIGLLNIVGEVAKLVSLAARLFGNIFAGNVMVAVITGLAAFTQFIVPIPFIVLSLFSGLIHAFVFTLLSIQFIALAIDGATKQPEEGGAQEPLPQAG